MSEPLPIFEALPELRVKLAQHRVVILQAPPGAGKSTVLPVELLGENWLEGQSVVMLEPRRLAARTVAARMASLLGEELGQTVGYRVRFESRVSSRTRLEVVTEGILTRRLQSDPGLEGVGLVIFDEFHERSLNADLALALCLEVQSALREDLKLLVMSATLDSEGLSGTLAASAGEVPVVTATGRQYPVEVRYLPRDLDTPLPALVAGAVSRALAEEQGDILVFLPGVGEISRVQELLEARHPGLYILPLYGELPLEQQQAAIVPDPVRRKVVLATSIAETSLTIEGIRVVVDSGWSRIPRFDSRTGLSRLETVRVSADSAEQRSGRAGRLGPGVCYRLWSQATQSQLVAQRKPEILEADLAPTLIELAQWGVRDVGQMAWVTPPPVGAVRQGYELLESLEAVELGEGRPPRRITERGRRMLELPTHPRIAHLLIEAQALAPATLQPPTSIERSRKTVGEASDWKALATDVAALLEERDPLPRNSSADLTLRVEALRRWQEDKTLLHGADRNVLSRSERLAAEWRRRLRVECDNAPPDPFRVGRLLALAYPDRVARLREGQGLKYKLSSGRGVRLNEYDPLQGQPWLAVAHLDAGEAEGRVWLAAPAHPDDLEPFGKTAEVVEWNPQLGTLVAQREFRIGEIALRTEPLRQVPEELRLRTLLRVVRSEGLGLFTWSEGLRQWQARVLSVRRWRGEGWPDVTDMQLLESLEDWLGPHLTRVNRRQDFTTLDLGAMLSALLPWELVRQLDELAPLRLQVPSGSMVRLEYAPDGSAPVLAVKLQELFGLADTPTVNGGRTKVMLHLLSPAQRPIQVTQDLRSFWQNTYPEVRKEMRGRYNKHPWPEDPWNATATRKTTSALRREGG
ncbi:MAG: ATP-dependent helicase HrpB [Meiothermus sp.]|nr:ATP-dependent helicase HrpB [Meiothermus sp.]